MVEENQVQPQENPGLFTSILNSLPRLFLMYMVMNYFFGGNKTPTVVPKTQQQQVTKDGVISTQVPSLPHVCLFRKMEMMVRNIKFFFLKIYFLEF